MNYTNLLLVLASLNYLFTALGTFSGIVSSFDQEKGPSKLQTAASSSGQKALETSDSSGNSNKVSTLTERLIVRFNDRKTPLPFDRLPLKAQNTDVVSDRSIIVRNLKNLKTYIIEIGSAYTDLEVEKLIKFLTDEGGDVEVNDVATLLPLEKKADNVQVGPNANDTTSTEDPINAVSNTSDITGDRWYMRVLNVRKAWRTLRRYTTTPVKVCVIDTGVEYTHPSLQGKVDINLSELNGVNGEDDDNNGAVDDVFGANFVDGNGDPMDFHGHGTNVAGIIASKTKSQQRLTGIHPSAQIIPCKAFDGNLKGRLSDILKCIDYCISREARIQTHTWTIKSESNALKAAFGTAEEKGVMMVVAVGQSLDDTSKLRNIDKRRVIPSMYSRYFTNVLTVSGLQMVSKEDAAQRLVLCKKRHKGVPCDPNKFSPYELYSKSYFGPILNHLVAPATDVNTLDLNKSSVLVDGVAIAAGVMAGVSSILLSLSLSEDPITPREAILFLRNSVITIKPLESRVRWAGYVDCNVVLVKMVAYYKALQERQKKLQFRPKKSKLKDELIVIV